MSARTSLVSAAIVLAVAASPVRGQAPAADSAWHGPRHVISVAFGMLPSMNVSAAGADSHGMLGGFSYQFWPAARWNIEVSAAAHSVGASAWETHAVTSLLFGGNWYPRPLSPDPAVRPYVGVALGAYMASETRVAEVRTQSIGGGRVAGGVDVFPAGWLRLGVRAAYHVTSDYSTPVDGLRNASGPELSLHLGVGFGRN